MFNLGFQVDNTCYFGAELDCFNLVDSQVWVTGTVQGGVDSEEDLTPPLSHMVVVFSLTLVFRWELLR